MPEQAPRTISHQGDVREAKELTRRFNRADMKHWGEFIWSEFNRRQTLERRRDVEKLWREVDRQIALKPDISHKLKADGTLNPERSWMPEHEEPGQVQTLERAQKDAEALMFPRVGPYFIARGAMTPEYEERVDFAKLNVGATGVTQEVVNKLSTAWHTDIQGRYPFRAHWSQLVGEALKYGLFAGRVRPVKQLMMVPTGKGVVQKNKVFPALIPRSIKSVYPDDNVYNVMNDGIMLGGAVVEHKFQRLTDLQMAAAKGSTNPDDDMGGWMPAALRKVEAVRTDGAIEVVEYEGDMIIPRKTTGSIFLPGVITSVMSNGKDAPIVFRLRFRKEAQSSYLIHPYHRENVDDAYSNGLLMKASPTQNASSKAFVLGLASGHLNVLPPVGFDRDDAAFEATGGPIIKPGAKWRTNGKVNVEQIGDPQILFNVYLQLAEQYKEMTGQTGPRAGAPTRSHTTLGAKRAELARGEVPITGFVDTVLEDPMVRFLSLEWEMSRRLMKEDQLAYIDEWGFATMNQDMLPDQVHYEVFGAAGPLEERQDKQDKAAALQLAVQLDTLREQLQRPGLKLDINETQRKLLRDAGFPEPDQFFESGTDVLLESATGGSTAAPGVASSGAPAARLVQGGG